MPKPRVRIHAAEEEQNTAVRACGLPLEAFIWTDLASVILDADPAAEQLLGYGHGEMTGEDLQIVFFGAVPDVGTGPHKLKTNAGELVEATVALSTVRDGKEKATGFVIRLSDITRHGNEAQQYELVVNNFPVATFIVQDGKFKYTNLQFQSEMGFKEDELVDVDPLGLVHPEDRARLKEAVDACMEGDEPYTCEFRAVTRRGEIKLGYGRITSVSHEGRSAALGSYVLVDEDHTTEEKLRARHDEIQVYALELEAANSELREAQQQLIEANRRLREGEAKYRSLAENANDILYSMDTEGTMTYISPSVGRYGWTPDEIISRPFLDFISAEDTRMIAGEFARTMRTGDEFPSTFRLLGKDGNEHWVEDHGKVHLDEAGRVIGLTGVLRDITERKRAEREIRTKHDQAQVYAYELEAANEELRQTQARLMETNTKLRGSEERFRAIFENANDEILYMDESGIIIDVNDRVEDIIGYKPKEVIGKNFAELGAMMAKSDTPGMAARFDKWVDRGKDGRALVEMEAVHKDGSPVFLEASIRLIGQDGKTQGLLSIVRNITERKLAEEALRESEERYRGLVELANDGIAIIQDSIIQYVNPRAMDILGYTSEEMTGTPMTDYIHPDELSCVIDRYARRMAGEDVPHLYESVFVNKNGQTVNVEVSAGVIKFGGGLADLVIVRDITERKLAEEALRESQKHLAKAQQIAHIGSWEWDVVANRVQRSDGVFRLYGIQRGSVTSETILHDMIHPDDREQFDKVIADAIAGHAPGVLDYRIVRPDGEVRFLHAEAEVQCDESGNVTRILGTVQDVTERRQAEDALRQREERFRSLIENAPDMILITDANGCILYGSPSIERLHGYKPEELIGAGGMDFVHPDDLPRVIEILNNKPGDYPTFVEVRVRHKDGSWRWIEMTATNLLDHPEIGGFVVNYRDNTERRRAEEAMKESEEKYRSIIENIQDVYYRTDLDGNLTMISPSGLRLLEYGSEEAILGTKVEQTFYADDEEREAFLKALEENGEVYNFEVSLKTSDGTPVYVLASSHYHYDKQGNQAGIEGVFTDVTERKQAQEEQRKLMISLEEQNQIITASHFELEETIEKLEKAHEDLKNSQEQLLQSEKLAAIGELVSGVAHEVNNPLMAISGHAELLLEDVQDELIRRPLEMISSESDRAIDIVQNLLSFARKQRSEKALISINDSIESTVKLRSYELALDNIQVTMDFDPDLPKVRADAQQLKQVFLNLINNAAFEMKESHEMGQLLIRTEKLGDDQVRITFADDGLGVDPEILDRIFEPFFTTKDIGKGTGLGLSICYGIIRDHCGRLTAQNRDDGGVAFMIELPIDHD